ncbi:MAG TPA: hypothetical protein VK817_09430 [Trebonia sp.]|nr:hypothetical protein [Trebonia sp.]
MALENVAGCILLEAVEYVVADPKTCTGPEVRTSGPVVATRAVITAVAR